ncbi:MULTISPECIES: STAS-like domain-containing protein [unclassified Shewanella]|uniref:STAS-like domain-containing protein n=1 Tax=unclassified Shewanella TaxID=196818 RepID=UPI0021DA62CE|nr:MULTISPECIES: STAS-like domain-containing protein [unclassified Shewanella]MCU8035032.1 STAS-like domain-containing protein [Shewanella sp. SM71]MCU8096902.1 STAS-like domain-containing protein [Shewanella sp. SM102]
MDILVADVIGKTAISRESGKKVKDVIDTVVSSDEHICLNFEGISIYASPFFNEAVATYLGDMDVKKMKEKFSFINLTDVGRRLLNQVIHNAIEFYAKSEAEQQKVQAGIESGLE